MIPSMQKLKKSILECLRNLKGSGKFAVVNEAKFVIPGLTVEGMGEIAFPLQEWQAKELIRVAQKARFGKGSETVLDTNVRSAWEIDAKKLQFKNPKWIRFLENTILKIKKDLGLKDYKVTAHLYKLLVYEMGDFFLPHKDSEKEDGMFGSLVVDLPSNYKGGELVIRFEGEEVVADFANNADKYSIQSTAFYADCDHEVKPIKSGYRICLVYNLVQETAGTKIELHSVKSHADRLAKVFIKHPREKPYIILLGHQYTPQNYSYERLKLNDRFKADALLKAAKQLGFYAKLCLVTSYKLGVPLQNGYLDDEDVSVMEEVIDEWKGIEHWGKSEIPILDNVNFVEDELITSFALDENEPLIKESTGYMGNSGPDLMFWYHYGAVIIWSTEQNSQLLQMQTASTQLEWINYFNHTNQASENETKAVNTILTNGLNIERTSKIVGNYDVITDWLISQNDKTFLLNIKIEILQMLFINISTLSWVKLCEWLPKEVSKQIFKRLAKEPKQVVVEKILNAICFIASNSDTIGLAKKLASQLPSYLRSLSRKTYPQLNSQSLSNLFWIETKFSHKNVWIEKINDVLTISPDRRYIHKVLIPCLLSEKTNSKLCRLLLNFCQLFLQQRVDKKPQPPVNWIRPIPDCNFNNHIWKKLQPFMDSPDEQVMDLKMLKEERKNVEYAILDAKVDLETTTIKKGSPHTLRITKTQATYESNLKKWKEDLNLLKVLKEFPISSN
ncbi:MAG: 2OG-Fe(II) oxygenase [Leptospira sp.]|nr:2OG-Fe(II) oxygenase [Leptospira sp.]